MNNICNLLPRREVRLGTTYKERFNYGIYDSNIDSGHWGELVWPISALAGFFGQNIKTVRWKARAAALGLYCWRSVCFDSAGSLFSTDASGKIDGKGPLN